MLARSETLSSDQHQLKILPSGQYIGVRHYYFEIRIRCNKEPGFQIYLSSSAKEKEDEGGEDRNTLNEDEEDEDLENSEVDADAHEKDSNDDWNREETLTLQLITIIEK